MSRHETGRTLFMHRFVFDRSLRRGDVFTFGLRSWVTSEEDPPTNVSLLYTIPIGEASLHFNFLGPRPAALWRYGPIPDDAFAKDPEVAASGRIEPTHPSVSSYFIKPELNAC